MSFNSKKSVSADLSFIVVVLILISLLNWVLFASFRVRVYFLLIPLLLALQLYSNNILENYLQSKIKSTRWFSIMMAPGTILHELSHAAAAVITGCKISSISLFKPNKRTGVLGSVTYTPKYDHFNLIRDLIISFSPFFGASFAILATSRILFNQSITAGFTQLSLISFPTEIYSSLTFLTSSYANVFTNNPLIVIILYLQFCFAFGAAPSLFDFQNIPHSIRKNITGLLILFSIIILTTILVEYPLPLGSYSNLISELLLLSLNWIVLLLSLSAALIIFSFTVLYSITNWLKLKLTSKLITLLAFPLAYYLSLLVLSRPAALLAGWLTLTLTVFLFHNPQFFLKKSR